MADYEFKHEEVIQISAQDFTRFVKETLGIDNMVSFHTSMEVNESGEFQIDDAYWLIHKHILLDPKITIPKFDDEGNNEYVISCLRNGNTYYYNLPQVFNYMVKSGYLPEAKFMITF